MTLFIKQLLTIVTLTCPTIALLAQSKATSNRPPWISGEVPSWTVGELPHVDLEGNILRVEFTQDADPETAEKKAEQAVAHYILKKAGVYLSSDEDLTLIHENETRHKGNKTKDYGSVREQYKSQVKVNGKVYGRYTLIDKYTQYKGGRYYFAGLFLVAEQDMTLAALPPITYSMDRGAWRSMVIPGWAQLYTGRTMAGIGYMTVQAGLIASSIYFHNRADYSLLRMNEAHGIRTKQIYKKDHDEMLLYRNISIGACAAWYALNVIDAFTSKRGKLYYTVAYGQSTLAIAPTPMIAPESGALGFGLACNINF